VLNLYRPRWGRSDARQLAMYLCRELTELLSAVPEIQMLVTSLGYPWFQ